VPGGREMKRFTDQVVIAKSSTSNRRACDLVIP
jgi:hypothetical protein